MPEVKKCSKCGETKDVEQFGPRRGNPNGRGDCRTCNAKYARQYRQDNLEKYRAKRAADQRRLRRIPEEREKLRLAQKRCYKNGGTERQQRQLEQLKIRDFFRWKARKSYVWLSAQELREQWNKQGGLCALTGRTLDSSAELDHVIPRARGGQNTVDNAQWLHSAANQSKRSMLDAEFITLCREVIAWADRTSSAKSF